MSGKYRSRNFVLVLYPEDESHRTCLETLMQGGYQFAAILHNQDIWVDGESDKHTAGELKKEHWHVVLKFPNAKWNTAVAAELGIQENYLEECRNIDNALLYLIHDGYENKFQYDVEEVFGGLKTQLLKLLAPDEGSRVRQLVHLIDNIPKKCTYRQILLLACDNDLYSDFRRLGSGIKYLLEEHNACFFDEV